MLARKRLRKLPFTSYLESQVLMSVPDYYDDHEDHDGHDGHDDYDYNDNHDPDVQGDPDDHLNMMRLVTMMIMLTMMTISNMMTIAFIGKLRVVHKQVGGCLISYNIRPACVTRCEHCSVDRFE